MTPERASDRILPELCETMRAEISAVGGREVLFVGEVNAEGVVSAIRAVARGTPGEVPAPMPHMEHGDVVVHNHPSGGLFPSRADTRVAAELASAGIGSYIVDNEVSGIYVVVEPVVLKEITPLDEDRALALLEPGGPLSSIHDHYEYREEQAEMLRTVIQGFNTDSHTLCEAGTGVGKSLAYLIPAFLWAEQNEERVIIATATINLQHQLVEKDIPLVQKMLGTKVKAALVKGRGNYLCRNRLEEAYGELDLFDDADDDLAAIRGWAEETPSGSRSDVPFQVPDRLWSKVNADADSCSGIRCRKRGDCFLMKARKQAAGASVLVANHHLLFSDLAMRVSGLGFETTAVLPPFQRIVFDEAHNIEASATSYFSESLTRFALFKHTSRLFRRRKGRPLGLLAEMARRMSASIDFEHIEKLIGGVREQLDVLESSVALLLADATSFRLVGEPSEELGSALLEPVLELQQRILLLAEEVSKLVRELSDEDSEDPLVYDVRIAVRRLESAASMCERIRAYEDYPESVFWMERSRLPDGERFLRLVITPIDISELMQEAVYEPYRSVVFTSATLTVSQTFAFFRSRIGVPDAPETAETAQTIEARFASPFAYDTRVLLGVPNDAPAPADPTYEEYLADFLRELLLTSEGRALVLFTSYGMLARSYEAVSPAVRERGISIFRQGDDERSRLLGRFQTDMASVLFATDSFWEGVDAPGDALTVVVLCRLPFRVPTDPVQLARMEAVERRGGNPFMELSLPQAVMRFKQGFGRLMRRGTDRGVVVVTDTRIINKAYGSLFVSSLPATRQSFKERSLLLEDIERFLYESS